MTKREWMEQAEDLEDRAWRALEQGDEVKYELYWTRARACRANVAYGTEENYENTYDTQVGYDERLTGSS